MRKFMLLLVLTAFVCALFACGNVATEQQNEKQKSMTNKKILVAYFSRADENYGVGYITKGNTEIIAEMIAKETSADLFHIETVVSYPKEYDFCIEIAKKEASANARPEIKSDINIDAYDIIYIGYPIWWGEPPMAVYTFIEKHSWQGKTVIPFCTHEGSGLGNTERNIGNACKGATLQKGLALKGTTAQKSPEETRKILLNWLDK